MHCKPRWSCLSRPLRRLKTPAETAETHPAADQPIWSPIRELGARKRKKTSQLNWLDEATLLGRHGSERKMSLQIIYGHFSAQTDCPGGRDENKWGRIKRSAGSGGRSGAATSYLFHERREEKLLKRKMLLGLFLRTERWSALKKKIINLTVQVVFVELSLILTATSFPRTRFLFLSLDDN